jgi:pilus assembly protein CpaE
MPDQSKIRVLIVDDIAETRENIRRSLQFDSGIEVVGMAVNGHEAIPLSKELQPDVIIMDINMPDMDGITATEAILKHLPFTQIIMLSVQSDPNYMRKAMLVGARDFLAKPPSIDELISAIKRAGKYALEARQKEAQLSLQRSSETSSSPVFSNLSGKVIVVYGPKGGVGCTTIATNLALALMNVEKEVILVDGNMQYGDVAVMLNEQVRNYVFDLTMRSDDLDRDVVNTVVNVHSSTGLHILAAPPGPEYAEKVNGDQFIKVLDYLRGMYNYIVVDTNSYLSEVVQSSLAIADIIVLVTTQEIPSIKNASLFLHLADETGIDRKRIVFVMNSFDRRITISTERIAENLKQEIVVTIPVDEKLLVTGSINRGIPLMVDNKGHPLCKGVSSIAEIVVERLATHAFA